MATQSFASGIASLASVCSSVSQQQKQQNTSVVQSNKAQVVTLASASQHQNGGGGQSTIVTTTASQGAAHVVVVSNAEVQQQASSQQTEQTVVAANTNGGNTTQFIAVSVSDEESPNQGAVGLQPGHYVHYVDNSNDPTNLYSAANGQIAGYSVYNVTDSSTLYTPSTAATYYTTGSGTAVSYSQCVQWLIDNYETAEGVSLPRSTLYNHYLRHCKEHKLEPVNAASFGKLIRSVFLGLRTRRLGTRGNSKYHYYGIRVKPNSNLNQMGTDDSSPGPRSHSLSGSNKRYKSSPPIKADVNDSNSDTGNSNSGVHSGDSSHHTPSSVPQHPTPHQPTPQQHQHQQYLGDATSAIPAFTDSDLERALLPEGITQEDLQTFKSLYRDLCESFLEAVVSLQFSLVEQLWQSFWRSSSQNSEQEKVLCKSKLYSLCKCEAVLSFVRKADYQFYQNLVDVLIPDVLRPIPSSLTQAIRNFAKSLEGWLTSAMAGCPEDVQKIKVSSVSAFAQTLRRYTSLNHLAQAARAVLQNPSQINQMLADLNRVDFHNVQEQASWVCQCEDSMVQHLEQDFKLTLQQQNSLEQWAAWLESVVGKVLQPYQGKADFPKAARQFLLKWSFYSSMVIRDLTLRSAASFGSFHLIRLLYDEYMFYLIEHKVAKATGETPIAVMGEFIGLGSRMFSSGKEGGQSQRLTMALSSPGRMENGDQGLLSAGSASGGSSSGGSQVYTFTNGIKESGLSSLQQGLIGQPPVCIGGEVTSDHMPHKKLKAA